MMDLEGILLLVHTIEVFCSLREEKPENIDCSSLSNLVLNGVDSISQCDKRGNRKARKFNKKS